MTMTENAGRILIVDDVPDEMVILVTHLRREGYVVDFAQDEATAKRALKTARYDVAIVDALLQSDTQRMLEAILATEGVSKGAPAQGFSLTAWMRAYQPEVGIIMLTGPMTQADHVFMGLEAGADDYVFKKGLNLKVFAARIRALVRRCRPFDVDKIAQATFDLYLKPQKIVSRTGGIAYLTDAEFMTLKLLCVNRNRVVSREDILAYAPIEAQHKQRNRAVDTLVSKLRDKLKQIGIADPPIRTLRGKGYLLEDVTALEPVG
ncbi:MAG: response regulator transcription factor [Paracoccaceae bacterium]|nr:response regulator transcription factor [Paracoccaceae bacterium]